jgi:hypothetical protein
MAKPHSDPVMNIVEMARAELERHVRQKIEDDIVAKYLTLVEDEIRRTVHERTKHITLAGIESMRDLTQMRDELHVYIHMDDNE